MKSNLVKLSEKGNWTEKDEVAFNAIIVNMINQKKMFQDIGNKTELPVAFAIKNAQEYVLGLFSGITINLFANYWIGEHESGLSSEDLLYLYHKIAMSHKEIISGLFDNV